MKVTEDLKKISKNKHALDKLQNLSPQDAEELMNKVPEFIRNKMYAKNCSKAELQQLVDGWVSNPERIKAINHELKRHHRGFSIEPKVVLKEYH